MVTFGTVAGSVGFYPGRALEDSFTVVFVACGDPTLSVFLSVGHLLLCGVLDVECGDDHSGIVDGPIGAMKYFYVVRQDIPMSYKKTSPVSPSSHYGISSGRSPRLGFASKTQEGRHYEPMMVATAA